MIIGILIVLGLCLGSFVNAFVWRLHMQGKVQSSSNKDQKGTDSKKRAHYSVVSGRSMCTDCEHGLAWYDLLPVLSWLALRGKCRYCKKPISWQYPIVELLTAVAFVASYIYWPAELDFYGSIYFALWLVCLVGFMALIVYDLRWMLLPNRIVFSLYWVVGGMVLVQTLSEQSLAPLLRASLGVLVGGGLFYLLFQISDGKWIGGGDVKLGFLLGAIVGGPDQALLLLFLASLFGSLVSVPLLLTKRANKGTRIPFGPFLILATFVVQIWGQNVTDWYINTLIG